MSWRETLRQGRRDVHQEMRVPAVYAKPDGTDPVRVDVRTHTRFATIQPKDVGPGTAALMDTTPRIVFDRTEVPQPLRTHLVVVGPSEAYRLGPSRPPKPQFITVPVTELSEAEAIALWQPEWAELLL